MLHSLARRAVAATALLVAVAVGTGPVGAQEESPEDDTTPGLPVPPDSDLGVVHSWALAPAGAGSGSQSGDRANLTYEMAPGTQVRDQVTLFNFSNVPLEFELFPIDARNNEDGSFTPVSPDTEQRGVGAWVFLPIDTIEVGAGQSATFDVFVSVPPDARPGDHAGAILASNDARGTSPDGRVVTLDRQTGSRVYIRVAGELNPELAVTRVSTDYSPRLNPLGGSATVTYRIENRGNVRLAGTHQVSMSGPFGMFTSSGPVHDLPELLPGASLEFTETVDDVSATVASFASVDLEAVTVDGAPADIEVEDRRAIGLAVPYLLVALLVAAPLVRFAWMRYRRHGEDTRSAPDEPLEEDALEHQPA